MKKRTIIYSILLVLLVGFVLVIYNAFNGNPLSKLLAKRELTHYLTDTYPDKELHVRDGFYNFKFGEYTFEVRQIGAVPPDEETYEFSLQGFFKPTVIWDGIYYSNLDEPLIEKLEKEASDEITALLAKKVDSIVRIHVRIEILKGTYEQNTDWNKDLTLERPLSMHITLDATNDSEEGVLTTTKTIQRALNDAGYDYESVTINGNGFDHSEGKLDDTGYVKYYLSFEKETKLQLKDVRVEKSNLEKMG